MVPGLEGSGTCCKALVQEDGVGLGARKARVRILTQPLISRGTRDEFFILLNVPFLQGGKGNHSGRGRGLVCVLLLNSQFLAWSRSSVGICGVDE